MNINEYLRQFPFEYGFRVANGIICHDGFKMSVQASRTHYCSPRENNAREYSAFEVGYPSSREESLLPYAEDADCPTDTVYGYVPAEIIDEIIARHGGISNAKEA